MTFDTQKTRNDIFHNMLFGYSYDDIMKNNTKKVTASNQGFIFESICEILFVCKLVVTNFPYKMIQGKFHDLPNLGDSSYELINIKEILQKNIHQGNDASDITIKDNKGNIIPFSIKYGKHVSPLGTEVDRLFSEMRKAEIPEKNIKVGLIVRNKENITQHTYKHKNNPQKKQMEHIINNGLLFDEDDIRIAFARFQDAYYGSTSRSVIDIINTKVLDTTRKELKLKLHQKMFMLQILQNIKNGDKKHLIQNKPRSGKSILILSIVKELLKTKRRVLIMTSVPATIESFMSDLETYIQFDGIQYKTQKDFTKIESDFEGIIFSSVQYLKTKGTSKKDILQRLNVDVCIFDESHMGSSTEKTQKDIIKSINEDIINIFASGTGDKTRKFYRIPSKNIYEWDIEDEAYMKNIEDPISMEIMISRHGPLFEECLKDKLVNTDYSCCPIPVLIQPSIIQECINMIKDYNEKNGEDYGYSISSILALVQVNRKKESQPKYKDEFAICSNQDGRLFLKKVLETIISSNPMETTVMKQIEEIQTKYGSRHSTVDNPKIFIMYLPTNNGKGTIRQLQLALQKFIEKEKLWSDYHIAYSNSNSDIGDSKETYNQFIRTILVNTKKAKKKGCILLLGRKGGVGITYKDCDVTISLDDGHNLDEQKQRNYRALTDAEGKKIGISVDLNIQRTYYILSDIILKHKSAIKSDKSYAEVLQYMYKNKIFIFNPQQFNLGDCQEHIITKYFEEVSRRIREDIEEETLLDNLECDDVLHDRLQLRFSKKIKIIKPNKKLEGQQHDCPKPGEDKIQLDSLPGIPDAGESAESGGNTDEVEEEEEVEKINKTKELCKKLIPLMCLLSRTSGETDLEKILRDERYSSLFNSIIGKNFTLDTN